MSIDIQEIRLENAVLSGNENTIYIKGEFDQNEPELFLDSFFSKVLNQMSDELVIDIRDLYYFNSAAISSFLTFLIKAKDDSLITIRIDKNKMWQRVSMDVIESLDKSRIKLVD